MFQYIYNSLTFYTEVKENVPWIEHPPPNSHLNCYASPAVYFSSGILYTAISISEYTVTVVGYMMNWKGFARSSHGLINVFPASASKDQGKAPEKPKSQQLES